MKNKKINVPENWQLQSISEIGDVIAGGTPSTQNEDYWNGNILWATPTDITNLDWKYITETRRKITSEGLEKSNAKLLPVNSLLLCSRATVGRSAINKKEICTNQGFQNIIPSNKIDIEFLYYMINSYQIQKKLLRNAYGSTFLEIPNKDVKKIKILLPEHLEQQKISSILSNVDNIIHYTKQLINQLQLLKRGLIQQLFTQGIEHTEFKETKIGKIPKEWEIKNLLEISKLNPQYQVPEQEDYLFIPMDSVNEDDMRVKYWERRTKDNLTNTKFRDNDILFAKITPSTEHGKGALIQNLDENIGFGSTELVVLSPDQGAVLPEFLYYTTKTNDFRNRAVILMEGATGRQRVPKFFFETQKIAVPQLDEQKLITNKIQNLENKIHTEREIGKKTAEIKKGLMRELLTGKKRVSINA